MIGDVTINSGAFAPWLPSPDGSAATLSLHGRGKYLRGEAGTASVDLSLHGRGIYLRGKPA